jgi:hypothetical protein
MLAKSNVRLHLDALEHLCTIRCAEVPVHPPNQDSSIPRPGTGPGNHLMYHLPP